MITTAKIKAIQIGDRTQSQDQLMTPVSFKTMNATVRSPVNPTPLADDVLLFSLIKSLCLSN